MHMHRPELYGQTSKLGVELQWAWYTSHDWGSLLTFVDPAYIRGPKPWCEIFTV